MTVASMVGPRHSLIPDYASTAGAEAVDLAELAGLVLDPWQRYVLEHSLGERPDGMWAAKSVALVVPRQNGKGAILEARELAGLFLIPTDNLIIHTAHEFKTSSEHQRRLEFLIQNTPELHKQVKPKGYKHSHGEEGIELRNGKRIRFMTRTGGGGRGFSGDLVVLDEAMILPEKMLGALMPTLSAKTNPQVWYTGSAVDQLVHDQGVAFARIRERGIGGTSKSMAFFEWSFDARDPNGKPLGPDQLEMELDSAALAQANPGWGVRLNEEWIIDNEWEQMAARTFAVERYGVGDWPATDGSTQTVIGADQWKALTDENSRMVDPIGISFDVAPDRSWSSISAAGKRPDGLAHIEVVDRRPGTGWVSGRVAEICGKQNVSAVVCAARSPAAALLHEFEALNIEVEAVTEQDHANACGLIFDLVDQSRLRHLGTTELLAAVKGSSTRQMGDSWAWQRKTSKVDITPLVSSTLALWGTRIPFTDVEPAWAFG